MLAHEPTITLSQRNGYPLKLKLVWPETVGYEYIDKLAGRFEVTGAWSIKKDEVAAMYPADPRPYEDIEAKIVYPVCKIKIDLQFPPNYKIKPFCEFKLNNKTKKLALQHDPTKNIFTLEKLHQDELRYDKYPIYYIRWDVPD